MVGSATGGNITVIQLGGSTVDVGTSNFVSLLVFFNFLFCEGMEYRGNGMGGGGWWGGGE